MDKEKIDTLKVKPSLLGLSPKDSLPVKIIPRENDENILKRQFEPNKIVVSEILTNNINKNKNKNRVASGIVITIKSPTNKVSKKNEVFFMKDNPFITRKSRSISKERSARLNHPDDTREQGWIRTFYGESRKSENGAEIFCKTIDNMGYLKKKEDVKDKDKCDDPGHLQI